jgi:copper(I)-binding protein
MQRKGYFDMKYLSKAMALVLGVTFFGFLPQASSAHDYTVGSITVMHPWARATPGPAKAGAGYLGLKNNGATADRLVKAESNLSKRTELHTHIMEGGVMKMTHVEEGIEVPAGKEVMFEPGGFHVMFMGLKAPFKEGEMLPVTLYFAKAGKVEVQLTVKGVGAKSDDKMKMKHSH